MLVTTPAISLPIWLPIYIAIIVGVSLYECVFLSGILFYLEARRITEAQVHKYGPEIEGNPYIRRRLEKGNYSTPFLAYMSMFLISVPFPQIQKRK